MKTNFIIGCLFSLFCVSLSASAQEPVTDTHFLETILAANQESTIQQKLSIGGTNPWLCLRQCALQRDACMANTNTVDEARGCHIVYRICKRNCSQ